MRNERHKTVADNVSANHHFREVAKMIPHEEVDVSKMETTTPTREKSSAVGNAAAMREALMMVKRLFDGRLMWHPDIRKAHEAVNAALAKPQRNCDVGTPKEQSARFDAHCRKHMGCLTCPLREKDGGVPKHCELAWSQMPYKEVKK